MATPRFDRNQGVLGLTPATLTGGVRGSGHGCGSVDILSPRLAAALAATTSNVSTGILFYFIFFFIDNHSNISCNYLQYNTI